MTPSTYKPPLPTCSFPVLRLPAAQLLARAMALDAAPGAEPRQHMPHPHALLQGLPAAHFANEPNDHDEAEPITEESAHSTWVGTGFEILGPDDAAFSGSGYAFACSDSLDSAAADLPALDNLELDTAYDKPLERTVTPATTNGLIGYLAAAASLAAAAAVATAAACLDAY